MKSPPLLHPVSIDEVLQTLFTLDPAHTTSAPHHFVGRSTRIAAEVRNVYRDDPSAGISVFAIRKADPRAALLDAGFLLRFLREEEKATAAQLSRRVSIDVLGRIEECAEGVVVLTDCRFAENDPSLSLPP